MKATVNASELLVQWDESRRAGRAITPEELCRDYPERLPEIKSLIAALESIGGMATTQPDSGATSNEPGSGTHPSRYHALRPHAAGGLGEVWLGNDRELNRPVALKRVQHRFDHDAAARRRFVREAEVTARLQHPGIVPVYGLTRDDDDRLVYAMRFIEGRSLHEAILEYHATADPMQLRQLLQRFVSVCNTIAYAHQHGVIHRDIKPANIMLGDFGETLVVDWGVAKVAGGSETDSRDVAASPDVDGPATNTDATRAGSVLGTPAYMSPEQAVGSTVGPAADVFSLGATLYHILTNRPPYAATNSQESLALARVGTPPPLRQINRHIPRPLAAICAQALARRPDDRYHSALDLAADIERWLAGESVSADREPWAERALRWARRHRQSVSVGVASLAVAVAGLAIGAVLLSRQQQITAAQRDRANSNAQLAQQALDETVVAVAEHPRLVHGDFHAVRRELLAKAIPFYEKLVGQEGVNQDSDYRIGQAHYRLALVRQEMGDLEKALDDLDKARAMMAETRRRGDSGEEVLQDLAAAESSTGNVLAKLGRAADAEMAFRRAIEMLTQSSNLAQSPALARVRMNLGALLKDTGRLAEAEQELLKSCTDYAQIAATQPGDPALRRERAKAEYNLGYLYSDQGRFDDADAAYSRSLTLRQKLMADLPTIPAYRHELAQTYGSLGNLYEACKRSADAESAHRQSIDLLRHLAENYPSIPDYQRDLATSWNNLGIALNNLGKNGDSEQAYRHAMQIEENLSARYSAVPAYRQGLARSYSNLAVLFATQNRRTDAEPLYKKVVSIYEGLAQDFPDVVAFRLDRARTICNLGYLALEDARYQDAIDWQSQAVDVFAEIHRTSPQLAAARELLRNAHGGRAMAYSAMGKHAEALTDWDAALKASVAADRAEIALNRAATLVRLGRGQLARTEIAAMHSANEIAPPLLCEAAAVCAAAAEADASIADSAAALAMQLLMEAARVGVLAQANNLELLKTHANFKALRDRPEFQKLLADCAAP
jgi:serine/threonine-protein kinase